MSGESPTPSNSNLRVVSENDAQWFVNYVIAALEQKDLYRFTHSMNTIRAVIDDWAEELGIERTWDKTRPPADILDKVVFPEVLKRIQATQPTPQQIDAQALLSLPEAELGKLLKLLLNRNAQG